MIIAGNNTKSEYQQNQNSHASHDNGSFSIHQLAKRGVANATALMNMTAKKKYYVYPVIDEIRGGQRTRLKAIDKSTTPKYLWGEGDPVTYYHLPNIKQHIADNNGLLYIAAGEVDVWTYLEAGIKNVIAWFGEGSVPKTLATDLLGQSVTHVIYLPDKDPTGMLSGTKVRDCLAGSGIHVEIKVLPDYLPEKADTNDLWQTVSFDPDKFLALIQNAPEMELPAPELKPQLKFDWSQFDIDEIDRKRNKAIKLELDRCGLFTGKTHKGFLQLRCIHHDDEIESAGFDPETGVINCFVCGSHSAEENAKALNLVAGVDYPKRPKKRRTAKNSSKSRTENEPGKPQRTETKIIDLSPKFDERGLPEWFKAALALIHGGSLALVVHHLVSHAAQNLDLDYSITELADISKVSRATLSKSIKKLQKLEVVKQLTLKEDNLLGSKSLTRYTINTNRQTLIYWFLKELNIRLRKHFGADDIVMIDRQMVEQTGIEDGVVFNDIVAMYQDSKITLQSSAEKNILLEMVFWRQHLTDSRHDTYLEIDVNSITEWRIETYKQAVSQNPKRSSAEWRRILGTFHKNTVKNIREKAGYRSNVIAGQETRSIRISQSSKGNWKQVKKQIQTELKQLCRETSGRAIEACLILGHGSPVEIRLFEADLYLEMEKYGGDLLEIEFTIQSHAVHELMDETEAAELEEKRAQQRAQKASNSQSSEKKDSQPQTEPGEYALDWLRNQLSAVYYAIVGDTPPDYLTNIQILEDALYIWKNPTADYIEPIQEVRVAQ